MATIQSIQLTVQITEAVEGDAEPRVLHESIVLSPSTLHLLNEHNFFGHEQGKLAALEEAWSVVKRVIECFRSVGASPLPGDPGDESPTGGQPTP
jgi:hypothetical protein